MIKYRRNLLICSVGLGLAIIFFPLGIVWISLGSLSFFPLKDYLDLREDRRRKKRSERRYLHILEAANIYFQDAFSVGQFLRKLKSQSPPDDPEWSQTVLRVDQAYRSNFDPESLRNLLSTQLPQEADFFITALFGPETFREKMNEISLTSLKYFRQSLRLDLELEAAIATQKSEAQVMLLLPFLFRLILPRVLLSGAGRSPMSLFLSSLAWILAITAISLFLKLDRTDDSLDRIMDILRRTYEHIPSFKFVETTIYRGLSFKISFHLQAAWHMRSSSGRTRLNNQVFDPVLTQRLVEIISRSINLSFVIFIVFISMKNPIGAFGSLFILPALLYLKIVTDSKKAFQAIQEVFPKIQHRLYLYLIAGYSLQNAWQEVLTGLPPGSLTDDWENLQFLIQGGSPILEALTLWSHNLKVMEIQESIGLLQRFMESGSRDSLLRFGEQMLEQGGLSQYRKQIKKSQMQTGLMIPILLDLISIILICLIPALEAFTGM